MGGVAERHVVTHHADRDTADHVDHKNQDARRGVAANELTSTVHGTIKIGFRRHIRTTSLGLISINKTCV